MRKVMKSYGILKAEKTRNPAVVMQKLLILLQLLYNYNIVLFFSDQSYNSYRYLKCCYHILFWRFQISVM